MRQEQLEQDAAAQAWRETLYKPLPAGSRWADALQRFSAEELDNICQRWQVAHTEGIGVEEMAILLMSEMPVRVQQWVDVTRERHLMVLKAIVVSNGQLPDAPETIDDLLSWGMIYLVEAENGVGIVIPAELMEVLIPLLEDQHVWEQVQQNDQLMELVSGMMILYGAMPLEAAESMVRMQYMPFLETGRLEKLLNTEEARDDFVGRSDNLLHEVDLPNPDQLMTQVLELDGVPYATFEEDLVRRAGILGDMPFDREEQIKAADLLNKKLGGELEHSELLLQISMHRYNMNTPMEDVLDPLLDGMDIQSEGEYKAVANTLVDALGATPNWSMKGHRPLDVQDMLRMEADHGEDHH